MIVTCTHRSAEVQGIGVCYLTDWGKFGRVLQVATDVIIESQTHSLLTLLTASTEVLVIGKAGLQSTKAAILQELPLCTSCSRRRGRNVCKIAAAGVEAAFVRQQREHSTI